LVRKKLQKFVVVPYEIRNLKFECVELISDEVVSFEYMKESILDEMKKEGSNHPYDEVKNKIEKSQTIEELTELMDSVPH
jgi:hypothetical protein